MMNYLWAERVLLKNFGQHVQQISERIKNASLQVAQQQKRPIHYLHSRESKIPLLIAEKHGIRGEVSDL